MSLPVLSDQAERRIVAALEQVIGVEPDDDPDAAIAKAAAASNIPLGHIGLMTRAYNTARSAWQRESGSTTLDKGAAFPLASLPRVLEILCPEPVSKQATAVSPEYRRGPTWYTGRTPAGPPAPVRMEIKLAGTADPDALPKAMAAARRELARIDDDRLKLAAARNRVMRATHALSDALQRPGSPSFLDVKVGAEALHGAKGGKALDLVYTMAPTRFKLAAVQPYHATADFPGIYSALDELLAAGEDLNTQIPIYRSKVAEYEQRAVDLAAPWLGTPEPADPDKPSLFAPARPAPPLPAGASSLFDGDSDKQAAGIPAAVGVGLLVNQARAGIDSMITGFRHRTDPDRHVQGMLGKLEDPDHEAAISDIYNRAALGTMISRDPVLSSYDPRELAPPFNEIASIAPGLAANPMLVRPLLRKALNIGPLDSFEGSEALKTEKALRDTRAPEARRSEPKPGGKEKK